MPIRKRGPKPKHRNVRYIRYRLKYTVNCQLVEQTMVRDYLGRDVVARECDCDVLGELINEQEIIYLPVRNTKFDATVITESFKRMRNWIFNNLSVDDLLTYGFIRIGRAYFRETMKRRKNQVYR